MQALLDTIARLPLPTQAERLFHGRGGRFPGCEAWLLDAFPPAWLLTCFAPVEASQIEALQQAFAARWAQLGQPPEQLCWLLQCRQVGSEQRPETRLMAGTLPEPHSVDEDGTRYHVHLLRGQNHGLFVDMVEGRRFVRRFCQQRPGARVLNLFAYSCAFSVVALQAGAAEVINVDMSAGALATGRSNHQLNGVSAGARFLAHDLFKSWGKLLRGGPYDLVIADPPSYQKGSFVAEKDYPRLLRRLPELLTADGLALLCLNTPKLGPDFLLQHLAAEAPGLRLRERLANPAVLADVDEARSLKVLLVERGAPA